MGERRIVLSSVSCGLFYGQHTGFITVITVFYFSLVFHFFFVFMQVGCKKDFFVCHFSGNFFLSIIDGKLHVIACQQWSNLNEVFEKSQWRTCHM